VDAQPAAQAAATQRYPQSQGPPSTSSVLWAEWRRGLKDLQNIVLNPWQGYAATHEEPGTIGNLTNIEVYRNRHQESSPSQVSVQSEVPMQEQASVRSPADLVGGGVSGPAQGQQQSRQEVSPADLVEAKQNASVQGQQQRQQEVSPADLSEGRGGAQQQQQQTQRQGQSHSMSM
jgi:hypothetical protein